MSFVLGFVLGILIGWNQDKLKEFLELEKK